MVSVSLGVYILLAYHPEMDFLFEGTVLYAILIGTPVAIFAGLSAYYEKGELHRLVFSIIRVALSIIYFIVLFASINLGWEGDEFIYSISLTGLVLLTIIALILNGIYHALEYIIHRPKPPEVSKEENGYPPEDNRIVT